MKQVVETHCNAPLPSKDTLYYALKNYALKSASVRFSESRRAELNSPHVTILLLLGSEIGGAWMRRYSA